MKKLALLCVSVSLTFVVFAQEIQHEAIAINVEVPVNVFNETAESTGGITDSSANIAASFERASDASDNYYLLYYMPREYRADGKFRKIKVRVKDKNFRITHRSGYIAD